MTQTPAQTKTKSFLREYWYVVFLVCVFFLFLIAQLLRLLTPSVPIQENTWNGLTPGYSTLRQVEETLGQPLTTSQTNQGIVYYYQSDFPTIPTEVVANSSEKIVFIKERVTFDENNKLEKYVSILGEPDLVLTVEESRGALQSHVFLSKGVAVLAHIADNSVEQLWYFSPTTVQTFLQNWGVGLVEGEAGPEPFELE